MQICESWTMVRAFGDAVFSFFDTRIPKVECSGVSFLYILFIIFQLGVLHNSA